MTLPFTPAGAWFGFHAPPLMTLAAAGGLVVLYLIAAELLKPFAGVLRTLTGKARSMSPRDRPEAAMVSVRK